MNIEKLAEHVETLCEQRGVTRGFHRSGGRAFSSRRHIDIRPIRSVVTYAIAMHELGHVLGRGRSAPRLEREANAWAWAERNAIADAVDHPSWSSTVKRCLATYIVNAAPLDIAALQVIAEEIPARPGCPKIPARDHPFWTLLDRGVL